MRYSCDAVITRGDTNSLARSIDSSFLWISTMAASDGNELDWTTVGVRYRGEIPEDSSAFWVSIESKPREGSK